MVRFYLFNDLFSTTNNLLYIILLVIGCYIISTFIKSVDFLSKIFISIFNIVLFILMIPIKIVKFIIDLIFC